jgi:hypothetical protein
MTALKAELEELRQAMAVAKVMTGELPCTIINDPEEGLEAFKIQDLDQSKCYEIGPLAFPGDA